jgi:hypothetical protein
MVSVITFAIWSSDDTLQLYTDSAGGTNGVFGIFFSGRWTYSKWPAHWATSDIIRDMTFLELFPVYVAILLWHTLLSNQRIIFHIDNSTSCQHHYIQVNSGNEHCQKTRPPPASTQHHN